jgi:hypothetical protein
MSRVSMDKSYHTKLRLSFQVGNILREEIQEKDDDEYGAHTDQDICHKGVPILHLYLVLWVSRVCPDALSYTAGTAALPTGVCTPLTLRQIYAAALPSQTAPLPARSHPDTLQLKYITETGKSNGPRPGTPLACPLLMAPWSLFITLNIFLLRVYIFYVNAVFVGPF